MTRRARPRRITSRRPLAELVKRSLATAIERVRRSTSGADLVNGPSPIVECAVGWQGLRVLGGRLAQGAR